MLQPCTFNAAAVSSPYGRGMLYEIQQSGVATCGTRQAAIQAQNAKQENQIKNTPLQYMTTI